MTVTDGGAVRIRDATETDRPFLQRLYIDSRSHEVAGLGWAPAEVDALFGSQFALQERDWHDRFPSGAFCVVELDGSPTGRIVVAADRGALRLVDIVLRRDVRGVGVGTTLLRALIEDAAAEGVDVALSVLDANPARRLYERLGFVADGGDGMRTEMRWASGGGRTAGAGTAASAAAAAAEAAIARWIARFR